MDINSTKEFMLNIVRQIALLDLEAMREANADAARSQAEWDAVGAILEPTRYRDMLYDGTLKHAELQGAVVEHLIAIRELVDALEALRSKHHEYHTRRGGSHEHA